MILHALLSIFLHFVPNLAGVGLSIYQQHGIHLDRAAIYTNMNKKHRGNHK